MPKELKLKLNLIRHYKQEKAIRDKDKARIAQVSIGGGKIRLQ